MGPEEQLNAWLAAFEDALTRGDHTAVAELFEAGGYWRDLVAFTWNIKTLEGREEIRAMLDARAAETRPSGWAVDGAVAAANGTIEARIVFEAALAHGNGYVRLRDGKCLTLLTAMRALKGYEERTGATRPRGIEHGAFRDRKSWLQRKQESEGALGYTTQPYCLIVGGGQGGIALAARLKLLDVPTIVIDRNPKPGDSWRNRYDSLCLHDPVWIDHMPYIPFPAHWPVYTPKDQMGDWLEMYTKVMELNYWGSTTCTRARYDQAAGEWIVTVDRDGSEIELRPKQMVLATGMSGAPNMPDIPGAATFEGELVHSSQHRSAAPYRGKRCVILGSNNSAHDIAAALWEHSADVTMIQRSSTLVARSETLRSGPSNYSEAAVAAGITTEIADLIAASTPYAIMHLAGIEATNRMRTQDAEFYAALERVGFLLDFGDDGSGLGMKYQRRGSGYYIDVGASQLVIDGEVKLRSGVNIAEIKPRSVVLTDGTELPADLIVYATGFGSMNEWAADLISPEVADRVGKVWGLGSDTTKDPGPWEGEQRNMWKPTQQPGLWFHGGNLAQSRNYSKYVALQLKARMEGIPTPVYGMTPVHHLR